MYTIKYAKEVVRLHTRIITSPQKLKEMKDHINAVLNDIAKKAKGEFGEDNASEGKRI